MKKYFYKTFLLGFITLSLQITCLASELDLGAQSLSASANHTSLKRSRVSDCDSEEREKKRHRPSLDEPVAKEQDLAEVFPKQTFGMPTLDSAFKYLFHDDRILLAFVQLFAEKPMIASAQLLDLSLNPIKELKKARSVLGSKDTARLFESVMSTNKKNLRIQVRDSTDQWKAIPDGVKILKELSEVFPEVREAVPDQERNSQLDVVCQLSNDDFVLVEVQVAHQDYWDDRALAYAGAFYGNQLKKGGEWEDLKKVVAINILGGGNEETSYWKDTPDELVRHYQFISEVGEKRHVIDTLQLIQYNLMSTKLDTLDN